MKSSNNIFIRHVRLMSVVSINMVTSYDHSHKRGYDYAITLEYAF